MSKKNVQRLGIMGGTFDPIHYGHLVTAEAARDRFDLNKVIFVPSGHPPHKKDYQVTAGEHRYMMTMLAIATNPHFEVSRLEMDREGYSYAIDTVRQFFKMYHEGCELFFITGADAILEIFTWKNVPALVRLCSFIAATRPGFNKGEINRVIDRLGDCGAASVKLLEVPALAISSTDIRTRIKGGRSIKYLLPEPVEQYIYQERIYK